MVTRPMLEFGKVESTFTSNKYDIITVTLPPLPPTQYPYGNISLNKYQRILPGVRKWNQYLVNLLQMDLPVL